MAVLSGDDPNIILSFAGYYSPPPEDDPLVDQICGAPAESDSGSDREYAEPADRSVVNAYRQRLIDKVIVRDVPAERIILRYA